jgi:cytochrome P450
MESAPPLPVDDSTAVDEDDPFAAMDPEMAAHPQPMFKLLRDEMPVMPVENGVVVSRKVDVDIVLRDPATFSSNVDAVDLSNVRPLIPLQIDPPDHKKFRKLLDPIFAPR